MSLPSAEELHNLFTFDFDRGKMYWKERDLGLFATSSAGRSWNKKYAGEEAFYNCSDGYYCGRIFGKAYRAHRIIWAAYYGDEAPDGALIDHINGVPTDNRISNLRIVSRVGNMRNMKRHIGGKNPHAGVSRENSRWRATIMRNGKTQRLGLFETLEEAINARRNAEIDLGYHPNHGLISSERADGEKAIAPELALVDVWRDHSCKYDLSDDELTTVIEFSRFLIASGLSQGAPKEPQSG